MRGRFLRFMIPMAGLAAASMWRHRGPGFGPGYGEGRGFGRGFGPEGRWFGEGRGFFPGSRGFGGWGGKRERMFERGDLKYVVLSLVAEKPRHGYEVIRALEEQFSGMYTPSAGAVYPQLQLLEDLAYVTVSEADGKKVYTITEAGTAHLAERKDQVNAIRDRVQGRWRGSEEMRTLWAEMQSLIGSVAPKFQARVASGRLDADTVQRLRDVLTRTRTELEAILDEPAKTAF